MPETVFQRDKENIKGALKEDLTEMRRVAEEMSTATPLPKSEQMARYRRIRDDKTAWKEEIMSRVRAIGPEKPMALERAIAQVQEYADWGEREIAKEAEG